jgi:hypothetical protein
MKHVKSTSSLALNFSSGFSTVSSSSWNIYNNFKYNEVLKDSQLYDGILLKITDLLLSSALASRFFPYQNKSRLNRVMLPD